MLRSPITTVGTILLTLSVAILVPADAALAQQQQQQTAKRAAVSGSLKKSGPVGYRVRAEVVRLKDNPATPQIETDANILSQIRYEVAPVAAPIAVPELIGVAGPDNAPRRPAAADAPAISLSVSDDTGAVYPTRDFFLSDENIGAPTVGEALFRANSVQAVLDLFTPEGRYRLRPGASRVTLNINTPGGAQKLSYKLAQTQE